MEKKDPWDYERKKDWYDLYVASNHLNRLDEQKYPTWCFSDLWLWFVVARDGWTLSETAEHLRDSIIEEIGVPTDTRTVLYGHYQTILRLCD